MVKVTKTFLQCMSMVTCGKLYAAISPVKEATTATHMLGLKFTMKS